MTIKIKDLVKRLENCDPPYHESSSKINSQLDTDIGDALEALLVMAATIEKCRAAGFITPEGEVVGASLRKAINNQCLNEIDDAYRWAYREARLGCKPRRSRAVTARYGHLPACLQAYKEGWKHGEEDFNKAQEAARKAGEAAQ